jgi:hypothetical protein
MPSKVKIFDIRKVPSSDPARIGKFDRLVMYELDPMRRYVVRMDDETFNDEAMKQAIKEDMTERASYTGKELEIPD